MSANPGPAILGLSGGASVTTLPDGLERHELPSGAKLWFNPADHSYWRCKEDGSRGRRLTGVTTACKTLDHDPSALLKWAAKTNGIGIAELVRKTWPNGLEWLHDEDTIWRALVANKLTFDDVRDRAGVKGTTVHRDVFEALCKGEELPDMAGLAFEERLAGEGVLAFWAEHKPVPALCEQVVYSERLEVAGRLDFYGQIASRPGLGIIDVKTGSFLGAAAHAQVGGGYPLLVEESGWVAPEWALMLKVADGGYELVEAQATPMDFEAAVFTYRAAGRINNAARKAWKERVG